MTQPTRSQLDAMRALPAAIKAANCAAQPQKPDEQAAFEDWLYRVLPSGDCESVQSQWEESSDYDDFLLDLEEWEATQPTPSPLVGADGGTTQGPT